MKNHQKEVVYSSIIIPSITLSVILVIVFLSWLFFHNISPYQDKPEHWLPISLPELQNPVVLRVVYVENSRFKSLTEDQLKKILDKTSELVSEFFSVEVVFDYKKKTSIQSLFDNLPLDVKKYQSQKIVSIEDEQSGIETFNKIRNSIAQQIKHENNSEQSIIDYATPYLIDYKKINNIEELTTELTKTIMQRYQYWTEQLANDGKPVLDASPFNQWIYWDSLGYGDLPYEIVITNQLVASIEDNGMPVHTCLRGGITGGNMTFNKHSELGGFVFVSAFQIINDNKLMSYLREDETYTQQQTINYIAATLTHELGHLLFHYAHPFNAQSCIMNPTPLLHYRQWFDQLDVKKCQQLNSPMLKPGAVTLKYNVKW
ncbi:MAG: hypothetical protein OQK46_10730 [Gammaproteobacteria bacterium]|nr:hypothetical protein [Gammaproteobacteria bacterium]